jgi:hypothetical protein
MEFLPPLPDKLWAPSIFPSSGFQEHFSLGVKWLGIKADYSHLTLMLRIHGAILPLSHMSS